MMNKLKSVYEITVELKELLDPVITAKNREEVITRLNELIAARGEWVEQISPPYSDEEKALGEEIYSLNTKIEAKMQLIFSDLKQEMRQAQQQKKSQESYTNPYKQVQVSDGTYMDSKN